LQEEDMMKRLVAIGILVALVVPAAFAVDARVVRAEGTVRVSPDGSEEWRPVRTGAVLEPGSVVATGFRGRAVVAIGESRIDVSPLSQVSLAELRERDGRASTRLSLPYGEVRARVRNTPERENDFRVISPVSTASVKGTDFVFDGINLRVYEGDVAIENLIGQTHSVRDGQQSRAYGLEPIVSVETFLEEEALLQ
jgi:hypothetical protein